MDITVQREALLKPLQAVSGVVERKQTLPILSNVLLTVKDNSLLLTGTDLEIELIGVVTLESKKSDGATTVSARKLFDICRTLPEHSLLSLTLEKNYLVVRAGGSCFMLNTLSPNDFPNLESAEYNVNFPVQQSHLRSLFARTYFAMGQQDVRHYLNGALLDIGHQSIKCVAADGHRLAMATVHDPHIGDVAARVILPRKSVLELTRLLADGDNSEAMVNIGENRFRIQLKEYTFSTKLINAQYPDYNRLIPRGIQTASGEREAIKQALTRASILSNEKFRGIRFQLEPGKLMITANNTDLEQAEEALSIDYGGTKMEIGFNVAYLIDIMSVISSKIIKCVFTGPNDGVLIESGDEDHCLYVVMPMRL